MKQDRTTLVLSTRNAHKVQEIRAVLSDAFEYLTLDDFPGAPRVKEDASTFAGNAAKKAIELAHWLAAGPEAARRLVPRLAEGRILVLADDSGLEVDALDGAPGVHSARFGAMDRSAATNSTDAANNDKLLRLLKDVPWELRTARFRCVIAVAVVPSLVRAALKLTVAPQGSAKVSTLSPRGTSGERNEERGNQSERACSPPSDGGEGGFEMSDAAPATPPLDKSQIELFDGACEGRIGLAAKGSAGFGYDPLFFPIDSEQTFAELSEEAKNRISHRGKALAKLRESLSTLVARRGVR